MDTHMDEIDFESVDTTPSGDGLVQLQRLVDELDELDDSIEQLEDMLDSANKRYNHIKTKLIPDLLTQLQTDKWTNDRGTEVKAHSFTSGSLPKEDGPRQEALEHISEFEGGSALIKTFVTAEFGKGGHNMAMAVADDLKKAGATVTIESGIHAQSLQSFVKSLVKDGQNVDLRKVGVFIGRTAKITHKKVKAKDVK